MAAPGSASDLKEADADIQGHVDNVILKRNLYITRIYSDIFTCFKHSNSNQMKF